MHRFKPPTCRHDTSRVPILLLCDHASFDVPQQYAGLGVSPQDLQQHIGWDIGAAEVTRYLADHVGCRAVFAPYSRLLIDPNRTLDAPDLLPPVSDGVVIPGNQDLSETERAFRCEMFYEPYHAVIATQLADLKALGRPPLVIAVHSFTPVMAGRQRPWHVGVLWKDDVATAQKFIAGFGENADLVVGQNQPYSAITGPNGCLDQHCPGATVPHVLLEIRQDLIATPGGAKIWADHIHAVLRSHFADYLLP